MKLLNEEDFLKKYTIDQEEFNKTGLEWNQLELIFNDYINLIPHLEPSAILIFNALMKMPNIHSVRYRIKDPEHLIEKIIRRKKEDRNLEIKLDNYKNQFTDLIGLRALHLFKEDWMEIHDSISETWTLKQKPVANFRKGDSDNYFDKFKEKGCDTKEHKFGYRSVHYIVETQPAKQKYYAEIQVRTIFEEAWSEIDHTIRYPYDQENPVFLKFLLILNRLAGSADEMGTFVKFLQEEMQLKEKIHTEALNQKENSIADLRAKIRELKIDQSQKDILTMSLDDIKWPPIIDLSKLEGIKFPDFDYLNIDSISNLNDVFQNMDIDISKIDFHKVVKPKKKGN